MFVPQRKFLRKATILSFTFTAPVVSHILYKLIIKNCTIIDQPFCSKVSNSLMNSRRSIINTDRAHKILGPLPLPEAVLWKIDIGRDRLRYFSRELGNIDWRFTRAGADNKQIPFVNCELEGTQVVKDEKYVEW